MRYLRRPPRPPLPLFSLLLLLLSLTLAAAHPFSLLRQLLPATSLRIAANDLATTFSIVAPKQQCGQNVTHLRVNAQGGGSYFVLHRDILLDNVRCSSGGTFLVFTRAYFADVDDRVAAFLRDPPQRPVVDALDAANTPFLVGVENSNRLCGKSNVRPRTTFFFFSLDQPLDLSIPTVVQDQPLRVSLKKDLSYMVVVDSARNPCVYSAPAPIATTPSPSPDPPTPSPAASFAARTPSVSPLPAVDPDDPDASQDPDETADPTIDGPPSSPGPPTDPFPDLTDVAGTPSDPDGPVCFPADATVTLQNGRTKTMSQLQLGDRVLVAPGQYSPVFMFTHRLRAPTHTFLHLRTAAGPALALTDGHYLYVNGRLAPAKVVAPGDHLTLADGARTQVVAVAARRLRGLYNPQTLHGDIVVDGIRASTYTTAVAPPLAHALLAPLRLLFRAGLRNPSASLLDAGADKLLAPLRVRARPPAAQQ